MSPRRRIARGKRCGNSRPRAGFRKARPGAESTKAHDFGE